MSEWFFAFLFTQAVEVPIYSVALHRHPLASRLAIAFATSLLTHPVVWVLVIWYADRGYWRVVAGAEALAVLVEAAYLRAFTVRSALRWSLLANASSLGLGIVSRLMLGFP
jgi:hypothetical protein